MNQAPSVPLVGGGPDVARTGPLPGERLGRYVVVGVLGAGGMGTVYAAHDPELDRRVAIKVLHHGLHQARLLREGKAMARLTHPNIITIHDVGMWGGRVFLAMELVDGSTLRQWQAHPERSPDEILRAYLDAGRGLAAAHAAGFVHRDFKPDNVLVGRDGRVRVADFGLATAEGAADLPAARDAEADIETNSHTDTELPLPPSHGDRRPLTRSDAVLGTPAYMAPEQARGRTTDPRTDQYSFCLSLHEGLSASRPLSELATRPAVPGQMMPSRPDGQRLPDVPGWLHGILARGLTHDPEARYRSMDALLADVEAGMRKQEVRSGRIGGRYEIIASDVGALPLPARRALDRLTGRLVTLVELPAPLALPAEDPGAPRAPPSALRHPNLVPVRGWVVETDRVQLVLDLPEAAETLITAARGRSRSERVNWFAQLLRACAYLHRLGLAHGRLGAGQVLVVRGQVQLLPPIPPGGLADADLREAGSIGRGLFAGTSASGSGAASRSRDGNSAVPVSSPEAAADLAPDLAPALAPALALVLDRLTAVDVRSRFRNADEALVAWCTAAGGLVAAETVETRESFLLTAPLCGRETERARLAAAVRDAAVGRGGAFLIGGESGIGKSRLVEDIAGLGLFLGVQVLRGQQASAGAAPYWLWRDVARGLALSSAPSAFEAGVLLPVAPDLPALLGRSVPVPPELDAASQQARIAEVVERLLGRQTSPLVLVLEDLHWAGAESLAVLKVVARLARQRPLLVLATFRSDERPLLPSLLADLTHIELARLSSGALGDAAAGMLGEAGRNPAVLALLGRESEGNPFFLVEVVRALAEEVGGLDRIATAALPERVLAGGILQVVERRLSRVPLEARPVLRLAAVAGRRIDPDLVAALCQDPPSVWLDPGLEAGILEPHEGGLRFAHDKLREGLLLEIAPDERQRLHREVAGAIERLYPDSTEHRMALAHHWGQAGDEARELHHATVAGTHALAGGALVEGIRLLDRALALAEQRATSAEERARLHRQLGDAAFDLGDLGRANRHLVAALALLGHRLPRSSIGWVGFVLRSVGGRLLRRLLARAQPPSASPEARGLEASRAAGRLALIRAYQFKGIQVLGLSFLSVSLGERCGRENVFGLGVLGHGASLMGLPRLARGYFQRGRAAARLLDDKHGLAEVVLMEGNLLQGRGDLVGAVTMMEGGVPLVREIRDRVSESSLRGSIGMCLCSLGRFDEAAECFRGVVADLDGHSEQHRYNYVVGLVRALVCRGRLEEAWRVAEPCLGRFAPEAVHTRASFAGVLALLEAWRGDVPAALRAADEAMSLCPRVTDVPSICGFILEGVAEAYFVAWRDALASGGGEAARIGKRARKTARALESWAMLYTVGKPVAALYRGRALALQGKSEKARRHLREAVRSAGALSMRWHEAAAHLELGALEPAGTPARRGHLDLAHALFGETRAAVQLAAAEAALGRETR